MNGSAATVWRDATRLTALYSSGPWLQCYRRSLQMICFTVVDSIISEHQISLGRKIIKEDQVQIHTERR